MYGSLVTDLSPLDTRPANSLTATAPSIVAPIYPVATVTNKEVGVKFEHHFDAFRKANDIAPSRQRKWKGKHAPMHLLFVAVMAKGGFTAIGDKKEWSDIYLRIMGLVFDIRKHRNVWKAARDLYEQRMMEFEVYMKNQGATQDDPLMLLTQ